MNIPFSFSYVKLNGDKCIVRKALLRPMSKSEKDRNAKYKLQYVNTENQEKRSCFIPLITSFNGTKIELNK